MTLDGGLEAARLAEVYSRTAAFYDGVVAEDQAAAKMLAIEVLNRQAGERFLEVGVGTGWAFERIVAATGASGAIGLDVAPGMIEVARERFPDAGAPVFVLGDARRLPFARGSLDCVLCTHTFEVMSAADMRLTLADFRRVLRRRGRLVVLNLTDGESADDAAVSDRWRSGSRDDPEFYGGSRPIRLAPLLTEAGFEVVERRYSGHGAGWPSEVLLALAD